MHHHSGQCHCGNIRFTFETDIGLDNMTTRCCNCSFCQKHGGRYTSDPRGRLLIEISDDDNINRYRFGHQTADFFICRICGALPFVTSDIDGIIYAVLNVNCLDQVDQIIGLVNTVSYEAEVSDNRLTRRKKNWIGTVSFIT